MKYQYHLFSSLIFSVSNKLNHVSVTNIHRILILGTLTFFCNSHLITDNSAPSISFFSSCFLSVLCLMKGWAKERVDLYHSISFFIGYPDKRLEEQRGIEVKINKENKVSGLGQSCYFYYLGILRVWLYHSPASRRCEAWLSAFCDH